MEAEERLDHFAEHADAMLAGDDGEYYWTFAPFTDNSTFLALNDKEYQSWLDGQPSNRLKGIKKQNKLLQRYNAGTHNRNWRDMTWLRRSDDWYRCGAIASALEMTERQTKRVCDLYDRHIDMRAFPTSKYGEQDKWLVVPFCICVLVHNKNQRIDKNGDRDKRYAYYPGKSNFPPRKTYAGLIWNEYVAENDRHVHFMDFAESLSLDDKAIISCLERVRKKIPDFNPKPEFDQIRNEEVNQVIHVGAA